MAFFEIEENKKNYNWSMANLHSHSYFEVYYLQKGEREFFLNNNIFCVKENSVIIISPFTMHKTEGGNFARTNLNISPDFFNKNELDLINYLSKFGIIRLTQNQSHIFSETLKQIKNYNNDNSNISCAILHTLVCYLLFLLKEFISSSNYENYKPTNKQLPAIVLKIIKHINENYKNNITVKSISQTFFLSEGYTSKLFKKYTNFSISEYMLNLKITTAKQLLKNTKMNVEEISIETGFSSSNYFSLIFKKRVGFSPLGYRKFEKNKDS